jgi:hypothetical protein
VKTIGDLRKLPLVGLNKVSAYAAFNFAAYNLVRIGGMGGWWNPSPTLGNVRPKCERNKHDSIRERHRQ